MKIKRMLALALAAAMVCAQAPAAKAAEAPAVTTTDNVNIVFSHNNPESSAAGQAALKFKEEMETRSNGVVTVKVYANGELGSVPENDQALRQGRIQMVNGTAGGLVDPSLSYFDLPCMVSTPEEFEALFGRGTELREETEKRFNDMGMQVLSLVAGGFSIISSNKEFRDYAGMNGLKIRVSENPVFIEEFKDWGCSATPVAFGELYVALQQGLVEAQNNTLDTTVSAALYEQQKYIVKTNHSVQPLGMYMNKEFYDSMPEDVRALVDWVCENVIDDYTRELCVEAEKAAEQTVTDAGLEIIEFSDEDRTQMRADAQPVYDLIAEQAGAEIVNRIDELKAE